MNFNPLSWFRPTPKVAPAPRVVRVAPNLNDKRHEYTALGYRAVEVALKNGQQIPPAASADWHARYDRKQLIRMSQGFDRDNALYNAMISRAVDNIVGDGFKLQARTGDAELNKKIEALFAAWGKDPEVRGLHSWWSVERNALRALFVDGDVAALKVAGQRIQAIEALRVDTVHTTTTPDANGDRWEQGIKLDRVGRPLKYSVADFTVGGAVLPSSAVEYDAKDVVYLANLSRFSQTRGIPVNTPAFAMLHRINDIMDSEAIARQLLAKFAVAITRLGGPEKAFGESEENQDEPLRGEVGDRYTETPEGLFFHGEPGEELKSVDRNAPGPDFEQTIVTFLRFAGLPLGLPIELLLLDWSKTNYSSARAALEQAYRSFRCWQSLLRERWHAPIYNWLLTKWIEAGELPADKPEIFAHDWITPEFPWIDLLKEATAWGLKLDRGLCTQGEALKSLNKDRDVWLEMRKREVVEAIEAADEINAEHPEAHVDWQMFAGLPGASADTKAIEKSNNEPMNDRDPDEEEKRKEAA